jgi:hypothetical protein
METVGQLEERGETSTGKEFPATIAEPSSGVLPYRLANRRFHSVQSSLPSFPVTAVRRNLRRESNARAIAKMAKRECGLILGERTSCRSIHLSTAIKRRRS